MIQLENRNPYSKSEILSSILDIESKVSIFFQSISPELFYHNGLGGWSPAQNLSHLIDIGNGTILLLNTPRFLFSIFGKRKTQRDFETLLTDYIESKAVIQIGPIAPSKISSIDESKKLSVLIPNFKKVYDELNTIIFKIPESEFDEYSLPHPTMGMLSLREVLYLILIHPIHHCYKVEQKILKVTTE
ncbi:MAG TPA: DinB family protein [Leptospiraceae bacterium]|nr:DinB family protein [Leptospiraceae bacterium]HMW04748.1 DinB family protein [Leptospiraceae bacterium]HMX34325.1 DinB family protein [Leptospiraceae bacterium]HMY33078.1 DinB family protein [Leptospiraceae bacterium]HMZ65546.1 DinB family protein [Leptospiraceae bacterium]